MRVRLLSLWAVFAAGFLFAPASWAASYFVDSGAGKDSNSGLSEAAPWKTINKVNISTLPFGSTIYLKRGAVWREQLDLPSSGLTVDAYGTGPLPTFDSSAPITNWTPIGNGIYSRVVTLERLGVGALGNVTENGVFMTLAPWTGTAFGSLVNAPQGSYTYQTPLNLLYIKPATHPSGNAYLASTLLFGVHANGKSDILVQNINVRRVSLFGIRFSNCNRCTARNSTISDGGGAVVYTLSRPYLYTGNGIEYSGVSEDGLVDGVVVSNMFDSGMTPQSYERNSRLSRITFQNSTIERCGYAGIEISALPSGRPSTLGDIRVSGVTIRDSGRGWSGNRYGSNGHGILIQANDDNGTISGVQVSTTTVVNSVGDGVRISGEVGALGLNRLILAANNYGVNASNASGDARSLQLSLTSSLIFANRNSGLLYSSPASAGFGVVHNTFHDNGTINLAIFGQVAPAFVINNIFASSAPRTQLYVDGADGLQGASIDHNCYLAGPNMIGYQSVGHSSLPPFTAATGLEAHGAASPNILFNNPAAFDFSLQPGSPCVGRGSSGTGVAVDLLGSAFKNPPSSGALERYP